MICLFPQWKHTPPFDLILAALMEKVVEMMNQCLLLNTLSGKFNFRLYASSKGYGTMPMELRSHWGSLENLHSGGNDLF